MALSTRPMPIPSRDTQLPPPAVVREGAEARGHREKRNLGAAALLFVTPAPHLPPPVRPPSALLPLRLSYHRASHRYAPVSTRKQSGERGTRARKRARDHPSRLCGAQNHPTPQKNVRHSPTRSVHLGALAQGRRRQPAAVCLRSRHHNNSRSLAQPSLSHPSPRARLYPRAVWQCFRSSRLLSAPMPTPRLREIRSDARFGPKSTHKCPLACATSHKEIKEQAHRPSSEIACAKAARRTLGLFKPRVSLSKINWLFVQNKYPSSNRHRDLLLPKAPPYLIAGQVARVNNLHFRVHFAVAPTLATYFTPGGVLSSTRSYFRCTSGPLVHHPTYFPCTSRPLVHAPTFGRMYQRQFQVALRTGLRLVPEHNTAEGRRRSWDTNKGRLPVGLGDLTSSSSVLGISVANSMGNETPAGSGGDDRGAKPG